MWDGKSTSGWAGSPIEWPATNKLFAEYDDLTIQCYDDQDLPVPKWPAGPENPDRVDGDAPVKNANAPVTPPQIPAGALPGTTSAANSCYAFGTIVLATIFNAVI